MKYNKTCCLGENMEDFETHERGTAAELRMLRELARACIEAKAWEQHLPVDVNGATAKLKHFYGNKLNDENF
jgi:hypothetical protein